MPQTWTDFLDKRRKGKKRDMNGSGERPVEVSCEHGIEPSGFMKCWEILERLHNY
jgi:hypothetical protein